MPEAATKTIRWRREFRIVVDPDDGFPHLTTDPCLPLTTEILKTELYRLSKKEQDLIRRSMETLGSAKSTAQEYLRHGRKSDWWKEKVEAQLGGMTLSALEFVIEYGKEYAGADLGQEMPLSEANSCHYNSFAGARDADLPYAEGVARPILGDAVHHSWNVFPNIEGSQARDLTWPRGDLIRYFGIAIPLQHLYKLGELIDSETITPCGFFYKERWSEKVRDYLLEHVVSST